jgi:tetratricopeptide (TPR) repeat protein
MVRAIQSAARSADSAPVTSDLEAAPTAPPPSASIVPRRTWIAASAAGAVGLAALGGGWLWLAAESPEAARARGRGLEKDRRYAEAGQAYARALASRPDDLGKELWNLQDMAADSKRFADAVVLLRQLESLYALPSPPSVPGIGRWDVVNTLAWYLATVPGASDASRARALAEEAIGLAARDDARRANSLDTLAAACARAGDWERALSAIDEAINLTPSAEDRQSFEEHRASFRRKEAWEER